MSANELEALAEVQELDRRADQLRHRRANLPETAARRAIEGELAAARAEAERCSTRRRALEELRDDGERTTAANDARRRQLERKLAGASSTREADALTGELAALRARQSTLDDAVLAALEGLDDLEVALAALEPRLGELAAGAAEAARTEAVALAVVDAELAETVERRSAAAAGVEASLLRRYETLRARLDGVGLARVVERRCSGCNLALPSAELEALRHLAPGELGECSQCGRMLLS